MSVLDLPVKIAWMAFLTLAVGSMATAEDTKPSSVPAWRCYTGTEDTGIKNTYVTVAYEMSISTVESRLPEIAGPHGERLPAVSWVALPDQIKVTSELVAICHGKELWSFRYRSDDFGHNLDEVDAVVFAMETKNHYVRPFFVFFLGEPETFHFYFTSTMKVPFALSANTSAPGTGGYYSQYVFSFAKGVPHFLGRTDGGRHLDPKTFR